MNGPSVDMVWDPQTQMNSLECWDYSIELSCLQGPEDLQLAAELGKTLLERNKELENMIKSQQTIVEEQAQEIEYMKKQTAALREVNDSRLKIYEQLEVSIQDLERANHRLVIENTSDKKLIKSQCLTIESLEARCEEFQKKIDEVHEQHESLLRQQATSKSTTTAHTQTTLWKTSVTPGGSTQQNAAPPEEEVTDLMRQLQEARSQRAREQKKVTEIGQQLASLLQENNALEEQINIWRSKAQDVKNLQEEINALEEVRRGQLCGRCLRGIETKTHDEISVMLDQEEYDDISMAESLINDSQRDTESLTQDSNHEEVSSNDPKNPYRVLVEKYQALLEVQRRSTSRRKDGVPCMSLQEELEMSGEFNNFQSSTLEAELHQDTTKSVVGMNGTRGKTEICGKKPFSATPTDFSEAETLSSGFLDETSNKMTQTDGRPGSFLCSIADGEDCKFSIYDDNSPFESRFRKTPEYRQLFSEIFSVLKRAAEAKDEGEKLPLLDDSASTTVSQPQSSILAHEDLPSETTDDNQSVVSSVVASVVSEPPYRVKSSILTNSLNKRHNESESHEQGKHGKVDGKKHGNRLDYLSASVHVAKKSSRKHLNRRLLHNERATTPDVIPTTNPKIVAPKSNSGGKKKFRPFNAAEQNGTVCNEYSPTSKTKDTKDSPQTVKQCNLYARNNNDQHNNSFEYRDYKPSTASVEVARLKRLEMSYAEVLRLPNKSKVWNRRS
ncbi:PREDICTED: cerebellar degeneration-related protein 2-like [Dufourea novaeangliae]|uniref:Cerebellar degeneration-related protein 2-like n=1 Tax=Dufourea novaeangliae TaxID=178035 RepID=A0A154PCK6_DUFNO|nr:PREDICTED: cerebellar degeneration-related protein 2-like [Dufourea novaeangliae]KZC09144.1 Cerebellar degeneration-related protein 2-like [Dufourea novaeangliae]